MVLVVKRDVRGFCMWQSPVPNQYEDNDLSAQSVHNAFVCSYELNRPSFHSSTKRTKVLGAYCRSGVKKTHCACIDFSGAVAVTCFHTVTRPASSGEPLALAARSGRAARDRGVADDVDGFDLSSHNRKTARQWWNVEVLWCSVVSPRNMMGCWLAVGTLHHSHYLLQQIPLFTQRSSVSHRLRSPNWLE